MNDEEIPKQPIKIRKDIIAKDNRKWYEFWKKEPEYGINITLTKEQAEQAYFLSRDNKTATIKILKENYENIPEPETIEPILFLIKENGYTKTLENVKSGEFIIKTPKTEKSILLNPEKLTSIEMPNGRLYKGWIAYENCLTPYPEDPLYSSEMYRKAIQKVAINYRDVNEANVINAKTKMWLTIIGVVVVGLVLILSTDFGKQLLNQLKNPSTQQVIQTTTTTLKSLVNNTNKSISNIVMR